MVNSEKTRGWRLEIWGLESESQLFSYSVTLPLYILHFTLYISHFICVHPWLKIFHFDFGNYKKSPLGLLKASKK